MEDTICSFDYDLNKIVAYCFGSFRYSWFCRAQDFTINQFTNNVLSSTTYRNVDSKDASNSVDLNLDYIRTFKPSQEFSISGQYSQNKLTNNFLTDFLNNSEQITNRQNNFE
ncbi:MAG: hypothetical protein U5M51_09890 [Emticicia sp.]|nr:hypothetical protein [Emticicia sp.]